MKCSINLLLLTLGSALLGQSANSNHADDQPTEVYETLTIAEAREIVKAEKLAQHTELRDALLYQDAKTRAKAQPIIAMIKRYNAEARIQTKLLQYQAAEIENESETEAESQKEKKLEKTINPSREDRIRAKEASVRENPES